MWFDCIDAELWPLLTKTSLGVSTFPDHFANVTTRERDMDREGLASCLALEVWVKGCVKPTSHQSTSSAHKKCWLPWSDRSLRLEIFRRVPNGMKVVWRGTTNDLWHWQHVGDGNRITCDWRRQPSSIWLKSIVNWTFTTLYLAMGTMGMSRWNCCARCLHCTAIWGAEPSLNFYKALVLCVDLCVPCLYGAMRSRKNYKICRSFWKDLSVQRACLYGRTNVVYMYVHTCTCTHR